MKTITLRGLDDTLTGELKLLAQQEGKTINQVILDILREKLGMEKEKKFTTVHHDMDHLFGRWSKEEFRQIQEFIDSERRLDADRNRTKWNLKPQQKRMWES